MSESPITSIDFKVSELPLVLNALIHERDRLAAIMEEMVENDIPRHSWYYDTRRELQVVIERIAYVVAEANP